MGWAAIPKLAFVGLLIVGVVSGELRGKGLAVFVALGAGAWFGLPYLPRGGDFVTPTLAILDVVLVLVIFKGDVRLG
jgi:hypothetical protein